MPTPSQSSSNPTPDHSAQPAPERTPAWWQALSLSERAPTPNGVEIPDAVARRLQRWRAQTAFLDDAAFEAYFAAQGIEPRQLAALLAEPETDIQTRLPHARPWLEDLHAALRKMDVDMILDGPSGFLHLAAPIMAWAVTRTTDRLDAVFATARQNKTSGLVPDGLIETTVLSTLAQQLGPLVERTLVLEMHIARLQGELAGETPAARFAAFTARLRDPATRATIFAEYPVLGRHLITRARQTSDAIVELLTRLLDDWPAILTTFFAKHAPTQLTEIALGEGDTHGDGRTVAILTFDGGHKLVYKPRSLAVDAAFQRLLGWLNARGATPAYRLLTLLTRANYGWVEFIHGAPCATPEEVHRFYLRQGGYLALLYALYAGDFHFENLLAAGEHPMLIDLEALFHPNLSDYDADRPEQMAQRAIDDSVLSVSMLPQRLQFAGSAVAIDISGMGAGGRQMTPDKLPTWAGVGTDEMHLRREHMEFTTEGHRPVLDDAAIDVSTQGHAVAQGFTHIYQLLQEHRAELLASTGLLQEFAQTEVRIVARATRIYSLLLQENSHPDLLRNAPERDLFYARLWQEVADKPRLAALVPSEVADLHNGDVPIFHTQPGTRHIWNSRGQRIANYLPHTGLERVQARLAALNADDCARQVWYIHASFATINRQDSHARAPVPLAHATSPDAPPSADFIAAARAIGDRLEQTAHRGADYAIWIGLGLDGESWSLNPLTMHLYDGHAGVALFLAYLGHITGEQRYTELAAATLVTLRVEIEQYRASFHYPGAFNGWGGIIYTLAHLGALWQQPARWQEAHDLADLAAARLAQDENFDIIAGSAGFIGALAALWQCTRAAGLLTYMAQAAEHLAAHAIPQSVGVGWLVPNMGDAPLAGFSHGAAGIAWALLLAAHHIPDHTAAARYAELARAALAYERTLFDDHAQNWRDLRDETAAPEEADESPHRFMHAWCHGAPGIGLARLALLSHFNNARLHAEDDPHLHAEIDAALAGTAQFGLGGGHSLCHGDLGNLDLFIQAAQTLGRPDLLAQAQRHAQTVLAHQPQTGWLCGVPGGVETPGLMVGIAGIGYALLRLAAPAQTPSVLILEPPR
ncbi:MAG: type 2 lanthipeptide synthetase LanM family protein [Litorilinea sp.]